jgi:transcriptional regulator with XRE-family HTH domain
MTDNELFYKVLAKELKLERTKTGKTQQEVFMELGIHIGRVEMGHRSINFTTLLKLCNYYSIRVSEILLRVEVEIGQNLRNKDDQN